MMELDEPSHDELQPTSGIQAEPDSVVAAPYSDAPMDNENDQELNDESDLEVISAEVNVIAEVEEGKPEAAESEIEVEEIQHSKIEEVEEAELEYEEETVLEPYIEEIEETQPSIEAEIPAESAELTESAEMPGEQLMDSVEEVSTNQQLPGYLETETREQLINDTVNVDNSILDDTVLSSVNPRPPAQPEDLFKCEIDGIEVLSQLKGNVTLRIEDFHCLLFAASITGVDNGEELPSIIDDKETASMLLNAPMTEFFQFLNYQFSDIFFRGDELVAEFVDMDISLSEDNVYAHQCCLKCFLKLFTDLRNQTTGGQIPKELVINIYTQRKLTTSFARIVNIVATGHGFESVNAVVEVGEEEEEEEEEKEESSSNSEKQNGKTSKTYNVTEAEVVEISDSNEELAENESEDEVENNGDVEKDVEYQSTSVNQAMGETEKGTEIESVETETGLKLSSDTVRNQETEEEEAIPQFTEKIQTGDEHEELEDQLVDDYDSDVPYADSSKTADRGNSAPGPASSSKRALPDEDEAEADVVASGASEVEFGAAESVKRLKEAA